MILRRMLKFVAATALVLVLTVSTTLVWIGSDSGRDWLSRQVEYYSEGAVLISGLQGHPLSTLTAASIEYRDAQTKVLVQQARFSWAAKALLGGYLDILSVSASALQVYQLAGGEPVVTEGSSEIPFELISRLRLHAIDIGSIETFDLAGEMVAKLQHIKVANVAFSPELSGTVQLEAEGQSAKMQLSGLIENWKLQLAAHPLQGQYPGVDIQLLGKLLESGSMKLNAKLEQGPVQSDGQWSFAEGLIKATVSLEAQDQSAQIQLDGRLENWKLRIKAHPLQGLYPEIDLQLAGQSFEQADMQLKAQLEQGTIQSDGRFSFTEGLIRGAGKLQADFSPAKVQGQWLTTVETETSNVQLDLAGDADVGSQFNRALHFTTHVTMADGKLTGILHESGGDLAAKWDFTDGLLQLKIQMNKWLVPLTQAAGQLSGAVVSSVNTETSAWKVKADIPEGKLAGLMASLNIDGQGDGEVWQLHRGKVNVLGVNIETSGKGNAKGGQLQGSLHSKNLKAVLALAGSKKGKGAVDGDFRISGSLIKPKLDWNMQLRRLQSDWADVIQLQTKGWLLPNQTQGELSLEARGLRLEGGQSWQRLQMQAGLQKQELSVQTTAEGEIGWQMQMTAKAQGNNWSGKVRNLRLSYQSKPVLVMKELPWRWQDSELQIPQSNIRIIDIPSRISLNVSDRRPQISLEMPSVQAKALKPWLDEAQLQGIDGSLQLAVTVGGTWEMPSITVKSGSEKLSMPWPDADIDMAQPVVENLQLSASYAEQLLQWQISANASGESILRSEGHVPWLISLRPWVFSAVKQNPGRATASFQLGDLSIIQPLVPNIYPLTGKASISVDVFDPLGQLQADATLNLELTSLGIAELGMDLHGHADAKWQKDRGRVDVEMKSGEGVLSLQGPLSWPMGKMPSLNFKQFPLLQRPGQQVVINGQLDMNQHNKQAWIKGWVTTSKLSIEIPDTQPKPTSDLQWEQKPQQQKDDVKQPLIQLDVKLNLGKQAEIYGRGMKMQLAGELELTGSLKKPHLTGELTIPKGGIDFRNIHLDVLPKSRLVFTGDPERPLLYIQAGRKIEKILVGVQIDGPADALQSRLFSSPTMSDGEILAYLVTGRPLSTLGKDGAADAMSAAGFLLGSGSALQDVQDKVQRGLGLDSLEVNAGLESSKVAVGKKIGERTTVKLEETIAAESTTAVTLEYLLTNSITVFARQVQNAAPTLGLRYRKSWTDKAVKP